MSQSTTPEDVLKNFSKHFQEGFIQDPFTKKITYMISKGVNPYEIIEELLIAHKNLCDDYTKMVLEGPAPILLTDIQFIEKPKP